MSAEVITSQMNDVNDHNRFDQTELTSEFLSKISEQRVNAIFRLVPVMMLYSIIGTIAVVISANKQVFPPYLAIWSVLSIVAAVLCIWVWWKWSTSSIQIEKPKNFVRKIIAASVIFGSLWGVLPAIIFADGNAEQMHLVGMTTVGAVAAAGIMLSAIPLAIVGFIAPLALSFAIYLFLGSLPIGATVASLLMISVVFSLLTSLAYTKTLVRQTQSQVRIEEQNAVIGLLLKDFETNSSDWLWEIDAHDRITNASARFIEATGLSEDELQGTKITDLVHSTAEDLSLTVSAFIESIKHKLTISDMDIPVTLHNQQFWWSITGKPYYDDQGNYCGFKGVCSDITEHKKTENRVKFLAHNDALTGLFNRAQFIEILNQKVSHLERYGTPFSVLYIDLIKFKAINDDKGHPVGDKLLFQVGQRLSSQVRTSDVLARIGGDEFAIILDDEEQNNGEVGLANRIIDAISKPFDIDGDSIHIGACIGITKAPLNGTRPDQILRNTDLALYRAKKAGKGEFRFFKSEMDSQARECRTLESELSDALRNDEFILNYQPLVDADSKLPTGFEALIRWNHPIRGMVSPAEFIPLAEKSGLIVSIGEWVINEACKTAATWPDGYTVAVNLSPQQFLKNNIMKVVQDALKVSKLGANRLELEITESLLVERPEEVVKTLLELKKLGIAISMDDFGTGYSSLAYLMKFPFDKIKIDRSFVVAMDTDIAARDILKTIGSLGESLKMKITVEGVETLEQSEFLSQLNCHNLQGYYFSKPLMSQDVPAYLLKQMSKSVRPKIAASIEKAA